jgi:CBS domain-containing protein
MVANDIMTKTVITIGPRTPVKDVAKLLVHHRISATPVVDVKGKLVGMVSEADLISRKGKEARAIMSKELVTADEDKTVSEIAELMIHHRVNRVPVMRRGDIVGIVSRADIVRAIALGEHLTFHSPIYDV